MFTNSNSFLLLLIYIDNIVYKVHATIKSGKSNSELGILVQFHVHT